MSTKEISEDYQVHIKDASFGTIVSSIISQYKIEEIIETGTAEGSGSTQFLAKTGLPVVSLECNEDQHRIATFNLSSFSNVRLERAYSLFLKPMHLFVESDDVYTKLPSSIRVDQQPGRVSRDYYHNELNEHPIPENRLFELLNNDKTQLVFLDSSGGVGFLEFLSVLTHPKIEHKIVLMDDTKHLKHYRSRSFLIQFLPNWILGKDERFLWFHYCGSHSCEHLRSFPFTTCRTLEFL